MQRTNRFRVDRSSWSECIAQTDILFGVFYGLYRFLPFLWTIVVAITLFPATLDVLHTPCVLYTVFSLFEEVFVWDGKWINVKFLTYIKYGAKNDNYWHFIQEDFATLPISKEIREIRALDPRGRGGRVSNLYCWYFYIWKKNLRNQRNSLLVRKHFYAYCE